MTPVPVEVQAAPKRKRGRPRKDGRREAREVKPGKIEQQCGLPLAHLLETLPCQCDPGTQSNARGYMNSWNGYKLHIDTADCGIPVSALLTSASMHDSLAAIPLSLMTAERVTNLRPDGRGLLQHGIAGAQSKLGTGAVDRSQPARRRED